MTSEQSPLLASEQAAEADHNLIYLRFSPRRKHTIVALIAWAGFVPCTTRHFSFGRVHMTLTDHAGTIFFYPCDS